MVREVRLAAHVQARDGTHEIVVHPQPAHRVMRRGVDAHGYFVRVLTRDVHVHVEQIAVALGDDVAAEALDGIAEIEIYTDTGRSDTASFVHHLLRAARCDVARGEVAEARVETLEIVVALA